MILNFCISPMPQKSESVIPIEQIDGMIRTIRGTRVILDSDLAKIYGAPTFRFIDRHAAEVPFL